MSASVLKGLAICLVGVRGETVVRLLVLHVMITKFRQRKARVLCEFCGVSLKFWESTRNSDAIFGAGCV